MCVHVHVCVCVGVYGCVYVCVCVSERERAPDFENVCLSADLEIEWNGDETE